MAGTQTVSAGRILRELSFPADMVATSDDWGASKPDLGFFKHVIEVVPYAADEIATIRISSLAELPEWIAALNGK